MSRETQSGFTLIELMVTLLVAGILLGVGIPSFAEAIRNSRLSSQYNQMVGSLFLARSEAVKSGRMITLCPRASVGAEQCADDPDKWVNGWIVFVDEDVVAGDEASVGAEDTILALEPDIGGDNTVSAYVRDNGGDMERVGSLRYRPTGDVEWNGTSGNGSVLLCDPRGVEVSRVVNVILTGDIRPGRAVQGESVPRDAFNRAIECDS